MRQWIKLDVACLIFLGWKFEPYEWYDGSVKQLLWTPAWGTPSGDDFEWLTKTGSRIAPHDRLQPSLNLRDCWQVVEHANRIGNYTQKTALAYWFTQSNVWTYQHDDAARMICQAIIDIFEIKV